MKGPPQNFLLSKVPSSVLKNLLFINVIEIFEKKKKKKRKLSFWLYMCFFHKCHIPIYKFHIKVEKIPNDGPNGEELYTRCTSHLFPSLPFENFQSAEPKKNISRS